MTSVSMSSPLISFTPLIQTPDHNLVRISRTHNLPDEIHLVAGGQHKGIIINRLTHSQQFEELQNCLPWNFSVWLGNGKQEIRSFQFSFYSGVSPSEQSAVSQRFIKDLFSSFPKDYANFFKLCLKLMQKPDFQQLEAIDVDMKFAQANEAIPMPDVKEYANDAEIENVTIGHIQDVLEHAYPNGLSVDMIAESLRCPQEEIDAYLEELEKTGVAQRVPNQPNEWIRVDNFSIPESQHQAQSKHHPTVAIITCLFVEKQSIDAIIENSSTLHKYSKAGDSNVYTIGYIGEHRVVATKLAMIGDSREAITSAGSITTRLLGSFQHVEHVIIVGVGGGVPHYTDPNLHVRLGDVVVSHGSGFRDSGKKADAYVYAHNFVMNRKTEQIEGFATHEWSPKDNVLVDIVVNRNQSLEEEWHQTADRLMNELNETVKGNEYDFCKPPAESDVLTMQIGPDNVVVFPHPNPKHSQPNLHCGPIGAMVSVRKPQLSEVTPAAANDTNGPSKKENIPPSPPPKSKSNGSMNGEVPTVDQGVEDANWLNLNNQLKDKFAADNQLKAFDAGFDSVIAAINGSRIDSWVLIRGLADYQQGSTRLGRQWQPYASVNAAALVRTILHHVPPSK
uniref:Nucleoside phosphorylase domain-containing protein n=1 Tax=Ditylenchus dipsaci TaxID=166011 RepID=A0A915CR44_9BILA